MPSDGPWLTDAVLTISGSLVCRLLLLTVGTFVMISHSECRQSGMTECDRVECESPSQDSAQRTSWVFWGRWCIARRVAALLLLEQTRRRGVEDIAHYFEHRYCGTRVVTQEQFITHCVHKNVHRLHYNDTRGQYQRFPR